MRQLEKGTLGEKPPPLLFLCPILLLLPLSLCLMEKKSEGRTEHERVTCQGMVAISKGLVDGKGKGRAN